MKLYLPLLIVMITLSSCFEEDEPISPHIPGDEISYEFGSSMYTNEAYFDLGSNEVAADHSNALWMVKFGAGENDWDIRINSGNYYGVYPSGTAFEDSIPSSIPGDEWIFDHSAGYQDSSAFAGWVLFEKGDTLYSGQIYLIGKYNGITYKTSSAIQFLSVDTEGYNFRMKDWPGGEWAEFRVIKDELFNYIYFDTEDGKTVYGIEPARNSWDLLFTQYGSILYTDDGVPTPYFVRGVLINPNGVSVAVDSVMDFHKIGFEQLEGYSYHQYQDIIGYDWKDVEVDENSNTAVYTVRPGITYIIRDTEGFYYKMRFISYYNELGEKGFPVIEHAKL